MRRTVMHARYARIRHWLFIAGLPVTIAVLIPIWLARRYAVTVTAPSGLVDAALQLLGAALLLVGVALFASSLHQIAMRQEDALAPWDPPRRIAVSGPYRFVRNPMISGVAFMLCGEALALRSVPHACLAAAFLLLSLSYLSLLDEPQLEARFGDAYRRYRRHVPRLFPRLRPWRAENE
jgi:protein-S-isoprenylcysteine O-methyltransferase Ste14